MISAESRNANRPKYATDLKQHILTDKPRRHDSHYSLLIPKKHNMALVLSLRDHLNSSVFHRLL